MKNIIIYSILVYFIWSCKKDTITTTNNTDDGHNHTHVYIESKGFPKMPIPNDNPTSQEGIDLGRKLFYDPILSGDKSQSCASCHQQKYAFAEPFDVSTGIDNIKGTRNAMAIINSGWSTSLFWDGRSKTLEEQALGPVPNPIEMHLSWSDAVARLKNHPEYPKLFDTAFPNEEITKENVAKAIAQFERTLISNNSKYDSVNLGLTNYTSEEAEGLNLFFKEKAECFHCHATVLLTDNDFHNNGLDANPKDKGLYEFTGNSSDIGKMKTPTLRNLSFTGPYMHDGRFKTLEEVVDFYSDGIQDSPNLDPLMKVGGFKLTPDEKKKLVAFLRTLDDKNFTVNPKFSKP